MIIPKIYNWIKVVREKEHPNPKYKWADAEYRKKEHVIVVFDRFLKLSEERQQRTFRHEYAHAVWFILPRTYRIIWKLISNWKLIKILNAFWITTYTENSWVRSYAKQNHLEDFAVCVEYIGKPICSYAWDKVKMAHSLFNKFEKWVRKHIDD